MINLDLMKRVIYSLLLVIVAAITTGCDRETDKSYSFVLSTHSVSLPYTECSTTIEYDIVYQEESLDLTAFSLNATTKADWITSITASEYGVLEISVEENFSTEERSTEITLSADNTKPANVRITQLASPPKDSEKAEHTLMHYFFGTSLRNYFRNNLRDVTTAIGEGAMGKGCRYIYFIQESRYEGYIAEYHYSATDASAVEQHIADVVIEADKSVEEIIASTLSRMADIAPAHRYGVIMAGHGFGWVTRDMLNSDNVTEFALAPRMSSPWVAAAGAEPTRAFGENNVQADIAEIAEGIELSGVELDYILFDACFMSNIESIYELRNSANYIIASPCEIMAMGFPYHRVLRHLFANGGECSDLKSVAEAYYTFYRDEYVSQNRCGSIALYDCSEVDALAEATRSVMATATSEYDSSTLQTYEGQDPHTFYDFGQWCSTVATDTAALAAFEAQLERTVIAKYTLDSFYSALGEYGNYPIDTEAYSGVTTSAPCGNYGDEWSMTEWYKRVME